jgi:hypothetical protein
MGRQLENVDYQRVELGRLEVCLYIDSTLVYRGGVGDAVKRLAGDIYFGDSGLDEDGEAHTNISNTNRVEVKTF